MHRDISATVTAQLKIDRGGLALSLAAQALWGLSPLFWKLMTAIPAVEILAHRAIWASLILAAFLTLRASWGDVRSAVSDLRTLATLGVTTTLIGLSWSVYIWAVLHDQVLQASLGYYLNPLVTVLLGVVFLREKLSRFQVGSMALAAIGVSLMIWRQGELPWISLVLAASFSLYSLLRKTVQAEAEVGLFVETSLLSPLALLYLLYLARQGQGAFGAQDLGVDLLLIASGLVTALPLFLFTRGARRLPLTTVGILEYLGSTIQLLLAIFVFAEPFTWGHLAAFAFIWAALGLFTWDLRRGRKVGLDG